MARRACAVVGLILCPLLLSAQEPPDAAERIRLALERAAAAGVPVALLESKLAEGTAKRVPLERVAAAVEQRATALLQAARALAGLPGLGEAELGVSAEAMLAGVDGTTLRRVAQAAPAERRSVAIAVLGELAERGIAPERAADQVLAALRKGGDALTRLPAEAARPLRGGGPGASGGGPGRTGGAGGRAGAAGPRVGGPPASLPEAGQGAGKRERPDPGKGRKP